MRRNCNGTVFDYPCIQTFFARINVFLYWRLCKIERKTVWKWCHISKSDDPHHWAFTVCHAESIEILWISCCNSIWKKNVFNRNINSTACFIHFDFLVSTVTFVFQNWIVLFNQQIAILQPNTLNALSEFTKNTNAISIVITFWKQSPTGIWSISSKYLLKLEHIPIEINILIKRSIAWRWFFYRCLSSKQFGACLKRATLDRHSFA